MKKIIFLITVLTSSIAHAQTKGADSTSTQIVPGGNIPVSHESAPQERKFYIILSATDVELLGQVIDASTAPHVNVMQITRKVQEQLNAQVKSQAQPDSANIKNKVPATGKSRK